MSRNSELFKKVADQVERDPSCYHQCSTVECIGGWALALSGYDPDSPRCYLFEHTRRVIDERGDLIEATAQELLGLTDEEADILFDGRWSPANGVTVPSALRRLAGGETIESVTKAGFEPFRAR